jgi:hypothetical protein
MANKPKKNQRTGAANSNETAGTLPLHETLPGKNDGFPASGQQTRRIEADGAAARQARSKNE